jgi:PHS family inorganic phosphate transporter-like MFS transporter
MKLRDELVLSGSSNTAATNAAPAKPEKKASQLGTKLVDPKYTRLLWVTGGSWFIFDVAYYGVALFGGIIVNSLDSGDDNNVSSDESYRYATTHQIYALLTGIPASILTILAIRSFGARIVQIYGFLFQGVMFFVMSACYYPLLHSNSTLLLFLIYCMLLFSLNTGPSTTVSCVPCAVFPYEIRTTYIGVSAACGKVGAIVGSYIYSSLADATTLPTVMVICGCLACGGAVLSFFGLESDAPKQNVLNRNNGASQWQPQNFGIEMEKNRETKGGDDSMPGRAL